MKETEMKPGILDYDRVQFAFFVMVLGWWVHSNVLENWNFRYGLVETF